MERIKCCTFEGDKDIAEVRKSCHELILLKSLNVPAWKPELVVAKKDGVLVVGMVEHKRSCNKLGEAIKQVFGKDFWEEIKSEVESGDRSRGHGTTNCLRYLSIMGPLFTLFAIAKAERVSNTCCLSIEGTKTLEIVILICCDKMREKHKNVLEALKLIGLGISFRSIHLKKMESGQYFSIVPILLFEGGMDLKTCATHLVKTVNKGFTS